MTRSSNALNFMALMSRALGTDVREARRKQTEKAANSGCSDGSSKMDASGHDSAMPRPVNPMPSGSDVQNTVDRSSSVSVGVWMSAAPRPRSAKSGTKITNAMTMLAIPNWAGTSRCARMRSSASRVTWTMASAAIFHAIPRAAARFSSVGSEDTSITAYGRRRRAPLRGCTENHGRATACTSRSLVVVTRPYHDLLPWRALTPASGASRFRV